MGLIQDHIMPSDLVVAPSHTVVPSSPFAGSEKTSQVTDDAPVRPVRTVSFAAEPSVEYAQRTRTRRRRRSRSVRFGIESNGAQWIQLVTAVLNTLLLIYIAARIGR
jgi:hypothetical protein